MGKELSSLLQQHAMILVQALLGVITPNFRMVSVSEISKKIVITIVLEEDSKSDRDEIDDLVSEFEVLQPKPINFDIEVEISTNELLWPNESTIVVYRRKEE
ncbi:MAG: hypothetical protein V6Z89_02145 [Desulfobacter sp.]